MGDTSNATQRFKWTGRVFTDTMLTLPAGCVKPEERSLGVCPVWLSPSKKRSSHRDTDVLLAVLQSTGSTWSLNRVCWAPLLPFCFSLCREAPGIVLSPSMWIWSMTCDGTIPLRNKGWRVTGDTSQLQANGIFQLHAYNDSYCPVIGRRLNRIYSRFLKQNLESV